MTSTVWRSISNYSHPFQHFFHPPYPSSTPFTTFNFFPPPIHLPYTSFHFFLFSIFFHLSHTSLIPPPTPHTLHTSFHPTPSPTPSKPYSTLFPHSRFSSTSAHLFFIPSLHSFFLFFFFPLLTFFFHTYQFFSFVHSPLLPLLCFFIIDFLSIYYLFVSFFLLNHTQHSLVTPTKFEFLTHLDPPPLGVLILSFLIYNFYYKPHFNPQLSQ